MFTDSTDSNDNTEFVDTVVIGGGQAGLAIGSELARQGRDFVILDAAHRVGDAWRERWDSLRANTPARFDGLPGAPFPGDPLTFPTKDEIAAYLEDYAAMHGLPVRSGVHVDGLRRDGDRFVATAGSRSWESHNVVVATGGCQAPKVPDLAERLGDGIVQLHSSDYRNPAQLPAGPVLVVGVGNSGAEIARDIAPSHETLIAGTPSAQPPVRPNRTDARFVYPVIRFVGLHVLTMRNPIGRNAAAKLTAAPLLRTKVADLVAAGVRVVPRVTGVHHGRPAFADGTTCEVSSIIWCTGYRNDFEWIDLPAFGDDGEPMHHRGVVEAVPGLFFLGLEFLYALFSATLPGVGRDARYLAKRMPRPRFAAAARIAGSVHATSTR
ncbi:NAD(P)/FAD-dependent oxidoreductase [Agromyces sp. SYSU K20354]|uniref:flavin-containing monooxygenase n=1 Tax=Agromyces cavernae TaxID=2898659 RepID=UPI001E300C09|nr:NAD(P)-binding domain-containing protein [Agromyces cavernae]MCD2443640.1 NAD(P)/FAD-dependent oxidoreductase [Agromyces cavernae]